MNFSKVLIVSLKLPIGQWSSQPINTAGMLSFLRDSMSMYLVRHVLLPQGYTCKLVPSGSVLL